MALLAAAGAAAASPVERLLSAFWAADRLELGRAGWQLGARALADEIASPDRERVMAALAAAPHAEDAWALLDPLAGLAKSADRPRAVAAARAGAAIALELDRDRALSLDVPDQLLGEALASWNEVAADPGRWADVRVHALEAARGLAEALGDGELGFDAAARVVDDEPEVRRAVLELLPQPLSPEHRALAADRARTETELDVAAVALQVLCGGLAAGDEPAPILEALGSEGLSRTRELLALPPGGAPPAAMIDAALCAAAADDAESRRALSRFRGQLEPELGEVLSARLLWLE